MSPEIVPEELTTAIEKMKAELEQAKLYLQRLQQDRSKIKYVLDYNQDNYRYLKVHCGVIAIDYVKNISDQIKRLRIFLKHAEENIQKFENSVELQIKSIKKKQTELQEAYDKATKKVVQFKRKKNEQGRRKAKN